MNRFCPYCGNVTTPIICLRCRKRFGEICHECPAQDMTIVFDIEGDLMHICSDIPKELVEKYKREYGEK